MKWSFLLGFFPSLFLVNLGVWSLGPCMDVISESAKAKYWPNYPWPKDFP